ncbi:MAG: hypothetical protein ACI8RD_006904 [Bacillariaceae sp.]|jgi:hypothetical protein
MIGSEKEKNERCNVNEDVVPVIVTENDSGTNTTTDYNDGDDLTNHYYYYCCCITKFYWGNELLILAVLVISLAKIYPTWGAIYLVPQITARWIAVMYIFYWLD